MHLLEKLRGKETRRKLARGRFFERFGDKGHKRRLKRKAASERSLLVARSQLGRALPTAAEAAFWARVNRSQLGFRVRRQAQIGGRYIADFLVPAAKVIVELDGGIHRDIHNERYDAQRDEWLARRGYYVLRLSNETATTLLDSFLTELQVFVARLKV